MTGYTMLSNLDNEYVLQKKIQANSSWFPDEDDDFIPITYYLDENKKIITVLTTVNARQLDVLIAVLQSQLPHQSIKNYHVLVSLIGNGLTERHFITAHIPPGTEPIQLFDSKASDPEKFFSENASFNFWKTIKGIYWFP